MRDSLGRTLTMHPDNDLRPRVLLSVQRALIAQITPEMRAISVEYSPQQIRLWVYHDGPMSSEVLEDFDAEVVASVIADFPYPDRDDPAVDCTFVRCDSPAMVLVRGSLVFARYGTDLGAA